MSTFISVKVEKKRDQKKESKEAKPVLEQKTSFQSGKNPKWNETLTFDEIEEGDSIEFTMYNKLMFSSEEKLGSAILILEKLNNYNTTEWFVLHDEQRERIGSMLLYINAEEVLRSGKKKKDGKRLAPQSDEEDEANDIDEDLAESIDYRDHEISRSLIPKNSRNVMKQNEYKALQTQ